MIILIYLRSYFGIYNHPEIILIYFEKCITQINRIVLLENKNDTNKSKNIKLGNQY